MTPERITQSQRELRAKLVKATVVKYLIGKDDLADAVKCPGPNDHWAIIDNPTPGDGVADPKITIVSGDDLTQRALDSGWDPDED